ncbi:hypothetical protein I2494_12760 [Budviciaceae bacterium BWR-B9]|uniref:Uncharacterized protein n=2 Tax=Limnobaculum TaxID=2172100 RepID=A0A9D7FU64_9GAMM|nr:MULTISPECIES: hypothetical protein [Limnobaculum]MBK5073342.1 hypothetical protein [Limnobaculum xujianqingii]MBK5144578.1 hypothetical protein [Limnobaculum allomyrinae]MBK5176927.1 hypothetical protein [Limnobaculum xujianqingii]MBV7692193.1 hypothetical protein [Limnobaculum sp. M2-1]
MSSPYVHQTQNRVRIRSDYIQQHAAEVTDLIAKLELVPGIKEIQYRRYAGSVAIRFDSKVISAAALLETVESYGWLENSEERDFINNAVRLGAKTLLKGIALTTLKRTLGGSLVSAVAAIAR